jgi:hypothetical protein
MRQLSGRLDSLSTLLACCAVTPLLLTAAAMPLRAAQQDPNGIPPLPVNLLVNPNLNGGLNGWSVIGTVVYNSNDDQTGNPAQSGSALATINNGNPGDLTQCVTLPNFWRSVTFQASYYTKAEVANGASFAQIQFFSGPTCNGSFLSIVQQDSDEPATFEKIAFTGLTIPIDAQSARLTFGALDTNPTSSATVALDSFFFGYNQLPGTCGTDPTLLCVNNNRFQVTASFDLKCLTGSTSADGVRDTGEGGYLWCFDPTNPELFVKVLNACQASVGNTYWVFIAGLTNVGVSITVTDTQSGMHKTYTNPANTTFKPILDTVGLPVCP